LMSYDATNRLFEYTDAVASSAAISTNSFGTSHCHQVAPPADCYDAETGFWDGVISGRRSDGTPSGLAARLLIVGSAGNEGRPERHAENVAANGAYDAGESIYLDSDDNGLVSAADAVRGAPPQPAGTALINFTQTEMHADPGGLGRFNAGEGIYQDADGSRTVTAGDVRITATLPLVPGPVVAGDGDIGTALRQFVLWGNTRVPNSAKNSVEVANVRSDDMGLSPSSSRGPTDDGRTKPDVAGPGSDNSGDGGVRSTFPLNAYAVVTGTSMSTPAVSGSAGLLTQWYKNVCVPAGPSPEVLKALLIHSAQDLTAVPNVAGAFLGPDFAFGFGRTRVKEAVDLTPNHLTATAAVLGNTDVTVSIGRRQPLRVTLVWSDPAWTDAAAASPATGLLQNDLDLILIGPDGTQYTP
ncbi:MAG: S8 family serine peptidase, partial [Acidimicrobiales bacterium]